MEFVERLSGLSAGRASQPAAKLLSFTDLSPHVQRHLAQVRRTWWRRQRHRRTRRLPGAVVGAVPNLRLLPAWIVLVGLLSGSHQFAWTQDLHAVCKNVSGSRPMSQLCPPLQVYTTLTVALLLSAAGVWVSAATGFGSQGVGMIGFMVSVDLLPQGGVAGLGKECALRMDKDMLGRGQADHAPASAPWRTGVRAVDAVHPCHP